MQKRLDPGALEESTTMYRYDYSEKRSLPITIPSFQWVAAPGDRFVVSVKPLHIILCRVKLPKT